MKKIIATLLIIVVCLPIIACSVGTDNKEDSEKKVEERNDSYKKLSDFSQKTLGAIKGDLVEKYLLEKVSDVKIEYYDDASHLSDALINGDIDGIVAEEFLFEQLNEKDPNFKINIVDEVVAKKEYGMALSNKTKCKDLQKNISKFLEGNSNSEERKDGYNKWFENYEHGKTTAGNTITNSSDPILKIAMNGYYEPYSFKTENGLDGYYVEMMNTFCKLFKYKPEYIATKNDEDSLKMLKVGKADMAVDQIIDTKNSKGISFSSMMGKINVMVGYVDNIRENDKKLDDFAKKEVGAVKKYAIEKVFKEKYPDVKIKYYDKGIEMIEALEKGEIDGMIAYDAFLIYENHKNPKIKYVKETIDKFEDSFAISKKTKHKSLMKDLNKFIKNCKKNDDIIKIFDKWMYNKNKEKLSVKNNIKKSTAPILKVAVWDDYAPFSYKDKEGTQGCYIETVNEFCKKYNYKPEYVFMALDTENEGMLKTLEEGKCDIVPDMTVCKEYKKKANFADSIYSFDVVLFYLDK